jgi:hypothetical protein
VPASEAAAGDSSGLLSTFGANAQPPGAGGSVASTAASLAQPPTIDTEQSKRGSAARGVVNTSSMSPLARLVANEILAGRGVNATTSLVPLGQQAIGGPGSDYATQAEIAKAKAVPYDTTVGGITTHHVPGGALPETTTGGGDPGQQKAQEQELTTATADSTTKINLANTARNNLTDLQTARKLYDTAGAIGDADIGTAFSDETLKWLSDNSGFNLTRFSKGADVRAAVGNFLKGQLGSVAQQIQGDPNSPMRGVVQQFNAYIPDPAKMGAEQFNWALDMIQRGQNRIIEESGPALKFKQSNRTFDDARNYTNDLEALRQKRYAEENARPEKSPPKSDGGGSGFVDVPDQATGEKLPMGTKFKYPGGNPHGYISQGPS